MFTLCGYMPFRNDFCCGHASCPHCYHAIRNTNRNNSVPIKKGFGILSAKCEQHGTEQGILKV